MSPLRIIGGRCASDGDCAGLATGSVCSSGACIRGALITPDAAAEDAAESSVAASGCTSDPFARPSSERYVTLRPAPSYAANAMRRAGLAR